MKRIRTKFNKGNVNKTKTIVTYKFLRQMVKSSGNPLFIKVYSTLHSKPILQIIRKIFCSKNVFLSFTMGDDAPIFWERMAKVAEFLTH